VSLPFAEPGLATRGASPQMLSEAVSAYRTPTSTFFGASIEEGFWQTLAGQGFARGRVQRAELLAAEDELAPLDEAAWRASPWFREGLDWTGPVSTAAARERALIRDEVAARQRLLGAGSDSIGRMALGFAGGVVGALPTPENFVPFAGPALAAARAQALSRHVAALAAAAQAARQGRLGARVAAGAGMGAFDATLGGLLAMPIVAEGREFFGDEVTWAEMIQDLALGATAGAVLGGAMGGALGRDLRPPPPAARQDAALRALTQAATQLADTDRVDLAMMAPDARAELLRLRAEAARLRAMVTPEDDGTLAGRVAARAPQLTGTAAPGAAGRATTPGGMEVGFTYQVVEADSLVASHSLDGFRENPAFAQELQPRDRSSEERQQQVRNIAARLRPEEVEASPLTTTGAPIVGPDGLVESGNGRILAIRLAYAEGLPTAQAYRAMLVRQGFADAARMREPVLIRRRTTELDAAGRRRFVEESNSDVVDALTPAEQARVDATRLSPDVLARLASPDLTAAGNADFLRAFIAALPGREQRALSTQGALTADGLARVRRALAARAYGDAALVARLADAGEDAGPLARALMDAAPELARLRARIEAGQVRAELDALPALVRAVQRVQDALDNGKPLRPLLDQGSFLDAPDPVQRAWLRLLLTQPRSPTLGGVGRDTLAERFAAYARAATDAPSEPDMFGTPPPGLGDTMAAALRAAGFEDAPELRALTADPYTPPPPEPTDPPPPPVVNADASPAARAAAQAGFDLDPDSIARAATLPGLPQDLAQAIAEVNALAAKLDQAPAAWAEAAACAIRG
jgi:hypothetical protein